MAFQTDFEYLQDVISSFSWIPSGSPDGCKRISIDTSQNKVNESLKVCVCNENACNSSKQHRGIRLMFEVAPILFINYCALKHLFDI